MRFPPPPSGSSWKEWGERLNDFLKRTTSRLEFKSLGESIKDDAMLMWDNVNGYPVVSKNGVWRQVLLGDGQGFLYNTSDITAASIDTAYPIQFSGAHEGLTINGADITFDEGGTYYLSFTAQVYSTSSSSVTFYFFPRLNGQDVPLGATRATTHDNGRTSPVSKSALFTVEAGDTINAMWAVSSTSGSLKAFTATAFAPSTPSVTMSIQRVKG